MQPDELIRSAVERKRVLKELQENAGFRQMQILMQQQVDALQREILFAPCPSLDSALTQEYNKGKLEGRLCLTELIDAEIQSCDYEIANAKKVQDNDRRDDRGSTGNTNHAP